MSAESKHVKSSVSVPRKSPTERVYQQDQFKLFEEQDKINSFDDIDSALTPPGYTFQKYEGHVVFYYLETNVLNVPEVTDCVQVNQVVLQGFTFTFTITVLSQKGLSSYEKKYDAKLPKLYEIRGRAGVQYSRRVQRAQIQENKNILLQCYSIFTSSTLSFLTNIPIINENVSISILVPTEKND